MSGSELLRLAGEGVDEPTPAMRARARLCLNAEIRKAVRRPGVTWIQRSIAVAAASVAFGLVVTQPSAPPDAGNSRHVPEPSTDKLEMINSRIGEVRDRLRGAKGEQADALLDRLARLRIVRSEICSTFAPASTTSGCPPG